MADQPPPPYPGHPSGDTTKHPIPPDGSVPPGYPPQPTPGYPSAAGPAYQAQPHVAYPAATGYPPQPTAGYPPQPTAGYPPHPTAGYPPQPTAGYPPQAGQPGYPPPQFAQHKGYTGYPPPGQGHIQQPLGYTATNTNTTVVVTVSYISEPSFGNNILYVYHTPTRNWSTNHESVIGSRVCPIFYNVGQEHVGPSLFMSNQLYYKSMYYISYVMHKLSFIHAHVFTVYLFIISPVLTH